MQNFDAIQFERRAETVAGLLGAVANERRLMVLCKLVEWGEANVTALAEAVGLSQSALSQHLARLREEGLVDTRREAQTVWYSLPPGPAQTVIGTLYGIYCAPATRKAAKRSGTARRR